LNQIAGKYNFKISTKTEVMTFKRKDPVRYKVVINGNILKQVSNFKYLGCNLSCNYDEDVQTKLARFKIMCGTIRRVLGKQTRKATQLKFYKTMAIPSLLYGSEGRMLRRKDESSIQSAEMKFLRAVQGCARLDHFRN
jgi:hypothetical protein